VVDLAGRYNQEASQCACGNAPFLMDYGGMMDSTDLIGLQ